MARNARDEVERLLDAAERAGSCLVPDRVDVAQRLRRLVAGGALLSPRPGMFVRRCHWDGLPPDARDLHVIRALAVRHPGWVFCRQSAALAHGLWVSWEACGKVHVMSTQPANRRSTGIILRHHTTALNFVTVEGGVRVTSLDRTAFDCLRSLSFRVGLGVADSWLRITGRTREDLLDMVEDMGLSCPGVSQAWETASHADGRSENGGESYARAAMIELGFAAPELQVEVRDPIDRWRTYRPDYRWVLPDGSVVYGELDGRAKYTERDMVGDDLPEDVRQAERLRESRIALPGRSVVRFSRQDVDDPMRLSAILSAYGVPRGENPVSRQRVTTRHARLLGYATSIRVADRR